MKKLVIALAVAACAAVVNAAAFNWTSSGFGAAAKTINSKAGTALYSPETAYTLYLFDAGVTSQDTLLAGLRDNKAITAFTSVTTQALADNSQVTAQGFSYGSAGNEYNFYMAIVNGDDVFLSASTAASGQQADTTNVSFSGLGNATKNVFSDSTATFSSKGAGWYAVPEPPAGLLMLLGMAGLALRRRHA